MKNIMNAKSPMELKLSLDDYAKKSRENIDNVHGKMKVFENSKHYSLFQNHIALLISKDEIIKNYCHVVKDYQYDYKACEAIQKLFKYSMYPINSSIKISMNEIINLQSKLKDNINKKSVIYTINGGSGFELEQNRKNKIDEKKRSENRDRQNKDEKVITSNVNYSNLEIDDSYDSYDSYDNSEPIYDLNNFNEDDMESDFYEAEEPDYIY